MKLWIDCEYNSFQGELISMALVDENGAFWYKSLGCENPHEWVAKNVMPVIGIEKSEKKETQRSLRDFLCKYEKIHVIADWPEDIAYFCNFLIWGAGLRIDTPPLTMEIRRDLDAVSDITHNALSDALSIRKKYIEREILALKVML